MMAEAFAAQDTLPGNKTCNDAVLALENEDIGYTDFTALKQVSLAIKPGEKVALIGPSGAGKTTLLRRLFQLNPGRCAFVHQHYALVSGLSVFHNIYMGRLDRISVFENIRNLALPSKRRVREIRPIARSLGLEEKLFSRTGALSGGQQQRVGIGRALYRGGDILMADEPVASLDRVRQAQIMSLMTGTDKTVVSSLHAVELARQFFHRIVALKNRTVMFDLPVEQVSEERLQALYN
ncbi:MAG: ATP-binding cassette domain-containing protein [Desulfobacter sp.]